MKRISLMQNVSLTYIPSDKFKTSLLSAQMVVPLKKETAGWNALLVNTLGRGTQSCSDLTQLSRKLDLLYGARLEPVVRKKGENQIVGFLASCIDDRFLPRGVRLLEPLADLMGELFSAPAGGSLRKDYVQSEGENLAELIRSDVNDKRAYAGRRLLEEMCGKEPYGINRLGQADEVESITADALDAYYRTLLPTARFELFYCGSAPLERVEQALTHAFSPIPRAEPCLAPAPTLRYPAPSAPRMVTEEMDVGQGKLCMGFRTVSEDTVAAMLLNNLYGGTSSSRLFLHVREKLSLCYYVGSTFHRKKGIYTVSAGIECCNYQRASDEILEQLEILRLGQWEDWELEGARSSLRNALRSVEDSAGGLEDFTMGQLATGGRETLAELLSSADKVDADRMQKAARAITLDTVYFLKAKEGTR